MTNYNPEFYRIRGMLPRLISVHCKTEHVQKNNVITLINACSITGLSGLSGFNNRQLMYTALVHLIGNIIIIIFFIIINFI